MTYRQVPTTPRASAYSLQLADQQRRYLMLIAAVLPAAAILLAAAAVLALPLT